MENTEKSARTHNTLNLICVAVVAVLSAWLSYEFFTEPKFDFRIQWNMFRSDWLMLLYPVGLVLAIIRWGAWGHYTSEAVIETYENGRLIKTEEDKDIGHYLLGSLMFPLMGHFIVEPLIYAALIYYPIAGVCAVVGTWLPYCVSGFLAILLLVWAIWGGRIFRGKVGAIFLVVITLVFAGGIGWSANYMHGHKGEIGKLFAPVVRKTDGQGHMLPASYRVVKSVNVRESPSTKAAKLKTLSKDAFVRVDSVKVGADGRRWAAVCDKDSTSGWAVLNNLDFFMQLY